ncbi:MULTISPECIES: hypothetical protein [Psychrobacter]|nr:MULTISPECIES: hypothetical protein [Psychrobacter]
MNNSQKNEQDDLQKYLEEKAKQAQNSKRRKSRNRSLLMTLVS